MWTKFGAFVALLCTLSSTSANAAYTATSLRQDDCRGPPNAVTLVQGGSCVQAACASGEATSCSVDDVDMHLYDEFRNPNPYVYFRSYSDSACTQEEIVLGVRRYDGNCVQVDGKSKSYSVETDGSVQERSYATEDCKGDSTVKQWASTDVGESADGVVTTPAKCVDKLKVYVSKLTDLYKITTYFTDSRCTTPNRIVARETDSGEVVQAVTCAKDINGLYYSVDRDLVSDVFAYAKKTFGAQTSYMMLEFMHSMDCTVREGWSVYRADGECIDTSRGTTIQSRKVALDEEGDLVVRDYDSSQTCTGTPYDQGVDKRMLNAQTCDGGDRYYFHTAEAPAPTTTAPAPTTTTPAPTTTTPAPTTTAPTPTQSANVRQSGSNVVALSIAVAATLVAAVAASAFMA